VATFDQLSAEQRAIVELVLQRGKSYEQLADLLGMPEARVRELARDALVDLAPVSARRVEEDWRGQLADYVLGQQGGPEATATRGHLRHSEAARTWARSLLDSLEQLYPNGDMPAIPESERGARQRGLRKSAAARPAPATPEGAAPPRRETGAAVDSTVMRRRILAAGGAVVLVLVVVLLWPIGLLTGGDDNGSEPAASGGSSGSQSEASGGNSAPQGKAPAGIAVILGQGGQRAVRVDATNLVPSTKRFAYQVWLYNSPQDAESIGIQVTDRQGTYQGAGALPKDYAKYRYIDVSREPIDRNEAHSGDSVLRGRMPTLRKASGNKAAVLGQVVLSPPTG
jgi:Anti-sigma-K factor rskA/Sigma-70, region 4